jgi:MarR family transcriptional regulator, organic hydroperoxide resistance regulator
MSGVKPGVEMGVSVARLYKFAHAGGEDGISAANKTDNDSGRGDPTDTRISAGFLVRDTHLQFARALRGRLQPHKVTPGQWFFLRALWEEEGLSQRELSRRVGTTEPTTVSALRLLERNGVIRRQRNATDRRTINIFLTDAGRALKQDLLPYALEVNTVATAGLSTEEIDQLHAILSKIRDNLASEGV